MKGIEYPFFFGKIDSGLKRCETIICRAVI